jgi:hypothetical protein
VEQSVYVLEKGVYGSSNQSVNTMNATEFNLEQISFTNFTDEEKRLP